MSPEAKAFAEEHGGLWAEHSTYDAADWRHEVAEDATRQSYWDWVLSRIEEAKRGEPTG